MTEVQSRERRVLDALQKRYEARGFSFFKYPSRELIPEFLGDYTPDAIHWDPMEMSLSK
jgi:REase_AHJR-like